MDTLQSEVDIPAELYSKTEKKADHLAGSERAGVSLQGSSVKAAVKLPIGPFSMFNFHKTPVV